MSFDLEAGFNHIDLVTHIKSLILAETNNFSRSRPKDTVDLLWLTYNR